MKSIGKYNLKNKENNI